MRKVPLSASLALSIALSAGAINAAHPFTTDDAGVVGDRAFEIETSAGINAAQTADGGLVLKYGSGDRFDIGASFGASYHRHEAAAASLPVLCMKFALIENSLALSASSCLAEHDFALAAIGSFEKSATAFHINLGIASTADYAGTLVYAGSIQQSLGSFQIGAELFGDHRTMPNWQLGVAHSFKVPVTLSGGFGGTFISSDDLAATLALTFSLAPHQ